MAEVVGAALVDFAILNFAEGSAAMVVGEFLAANATAINLIAAVSDLRDSKTTRQERRDDDSQLCR